MSNLLPTSPDTRHPEWCDPEYCDLLRPDGPALGDHRGRPIVVEPIKSYDPRITAWLSQYGFEPPATADVFLFLRFEERDTAGEIEQLTTLNMRMVQAAPLVATLTELVRRAGNQVVIADGQADR